MKKIGILGTGNIGTDLLVKLIKLGYKDIAFVGRREDSEGIKFAKSLDFKTSIDGINYFKKNLDYDVVLDCTNAFDAKEHYSILKDLNIKVIDLTPAKIGQICVPSINGSDIQNYDNVNMITCGGQASLPLINAISENVNSVSYIEVVSQIASKSAGMSTRINIDNYIETTKYAICQFSKAKKCKVILNINPAEPCVDMQTTVFMKIDNLSELNFEKIVDKVYSRLKEIKEYVPYYELVMPPMITDNDILMLSVKVRGSGDYLPPYAGNLDIINCAAIKILENL
jgi:acetaldehyde dehydrogenase (acetylating)